MERDLNGPYVHQDWPAWRYDKDGNGKVFDSAGEVPAGWNETKPEADAAGRKSEGKAVSAAPPPPPPSNKTPAAPNGDGQPEVDAAGVAFDPDRHTGTLTKAGLWRMKVGVARPAEESAPLDL